MVRSLGLLSAGLLSILASVVLFTWLTDCASLKDSLRYLLIGSHPSPATWSFVSGLLLAPVAFALWKFRDTNQLWLIENQRKDTNLKDFQKLCEWASGTTLVEDEEISKRVYPSNVNNFPSEVTTRSSKLPEARIRELNSRRNGSEALQLSAVYQLRGYLLGDFGAQFQKPAFVLLAAIWQSLSNHAQRVAVSHLGSLKIPEDTAKSWPVHEFKELNQLPLAQAVGSCLLAHQNIALRQMVVDLPYHTFAGLDTTLPGLQPLSLANENLEGLNMQGAVLQGAQLQKSNLKNAHFEGADLSNANLQGADLSRGHFQWANLGDALLDETTIYSTHLQKASLVGARARRCLWVEPDLSGADLQSIRLENATLYFPNLEGALFHFSKLHGTAFLNPLFNKSTQFNRACTDRHTNVLVGVPEKTGKPAKLLLSPHLTHALRLHLRDNNQLLLGEKAYTEYADEWNELPPDQQNKIAANVMVYSRGGFNFNDDFPALEALDIVVGAWPPSTRSGQ